MNLIDSSQPTSVPHDGAKVSMGGKLWTVPALSFRQLKSLREKITKLGAVSATQQGMDNMDDMVEIVHAALLRNYPDLSIDAVSDMLDLSNAGVIVAAVMGQSGLVASGERRAVS